MALVVNTNVSALIAHRSLGNNSTKALKSMERLASGYRINHAGDDAAGLTIAENLDGQVRGSKQALRNSEDGVSILQIAEGGLSVISENLQRIRELVVQAANDTNSTAQRDAVELEIRARLNDNDRIAQSAAFNGIFLLNGSATNARLQIGANSSSATNTIDITAALANTTSTALGIVTSSVTYSTISSIDITTGTQARAFLVDVDSAITAITTRRSTIGSLQNQLDSVRDNLSLAIENFSASNSRIRDLDIAAESSTLAQYQILQQASVSILSQANQIPALTLSLLQR